MPSCDACACDTRTSKRPMSLDRLLSEAADVELAAIKLRAEVDALSADLESAEQLVFSKRGTSALKRMVRELRCERDAAAREEIPTRMGAAEFREAVGKLSKREKFLIDAHICGMGSREAYEYVTNLLSAWG